MEFEEVRPYVPGDEVRDIDWNVTARIGEPYVKRFVEERELTVMLVVDVSRSMRFGTAGSEKRELAAELCAVLGFAAISNNDRVGLVLAERPGRALRAARRAGAPTCCACCATCSAPTPEARGTRLGEAARFVLRTSHRRSLVFWISDFEDALDARDWRVLGRRHELTALVAARPARRDAAGGGLGRARGPRERAARALVDTSHRRVRDAYQREAARAARQIERGAARRRGARCSRCAPTARTCRC